MYADKDKYGAFLQCLQCAFIFDIAEKTPAVSQVNSLVSKPKQAAVEV
ncbi:MAG: hypothetical protein V3U26_02620 [Dehalococcoidia bacterium]